MKRILLMPVKNEEWILKQTLTAASLWADSIIIADQNSEDATPEICAEFPKVVYIRNTHVGLHQSHARQLLLDTARRLYGVDNLIFVLDADEVLSANVMDSASFWRTTALLMPGQSAVLQWIMLWRSVDVYRDDASIWAHNWKAFIFRDNGVYNYLEKRISEPRMPEQFLQSAITITDVKVLHFEFVNWNRLLAKQRRYRVFDYLQRMTLVSALKVNRMYWETKNERGLRLTRTPTEWWVGYEGIFSEADMQHPQRWYWYDKNVLEQIIAHGPAQLSWLDIWDINWREVYIDLHGKQVTVPRQLIDPRSVVQKLYHRWAQKYVAYNTLFTRLLKLFKI